MRRDTKRDNGSVSVNTLLFQSQRTHGVIITSSLRQNDVATSFWRNNDVNITLCVHWDGIGHYRCEKTNPQITKIALLHNMTVCCGSSMLRN